MNKEDLRILYMGTPELSASVLTYLIENGYNVVAVVANEDKKVGRKQIVEEVPTKKVALAHGIPVFQPHKIRLEYEFARDLKPDIILTLAYGKIIPQELLDIPSIISLNLHGSLLPKYRGAAPIQRAIIDGESVSGVTLMEMVDKMDAGRMFKKESFPITEDDDYESVCKKVVDASIKLIENDLMDVVNKVNLGEEQDESLVTFANKITEEDEKIDLTKNTAKVHYLIRGLSYIGAHLLLPDGRKLKIFKAIKRENMGLKCGELLINKKVYLGTIDGTLELVNVLLEGKKRMDEKDFANGNKSLSGLILH